MNSTQPHEDAASPDVDACPRHFRGVVYELIDPRDGMCRYIGQTFNAAQRRKAHTAKKPVYQHNSALYLWKHELSSAGLSPVFRVIEDGIPPERINEQERVWCRDRSDAGCDLLNRPVGRISGGDLLGSIKRHAIASSAREISEMLWAVDGQLRGRLPSGSGTRMHLFKCIKELASFINKIDD